MIAVAALQQNRFPAFVARTSLLQRDANTCGVFSNFFVQTEEPVPPYERDHRG
jgi:hypothetical protein